ncbi:lysozyme [Thorsellia anophelis]|uniref:Lysozyme n=1 Tax=Thorsellia anophelis DSM 18579 TaxID=1123402 RepID=A0A1I0EEA9_9GAMM|nr:lysozyme [Thorsellia anophelis]SET42785.1 Phage-related lysozyme (muramidase), GH24 family [Thorsellia anophelis DSM 18579]
MEILIEGYETTFNQIRTSQSDDDRTPSKELRISEKGIEFIKSWEALKLKAYNDSKGFCTIGYGHLIERNSCENITIPIEFQGGVIQAKADLMFASDLAPVEKVVQNLDIPLYQYEYVALASLLFNTGKNFFVENGAPKMYKYLQSKDYDLVANEFLDITNQGDKGLVRRRKAEYNIFTKDEYINNK